jgi:hypothetical protein
MAMVALHSMTGAVAGMDAAATVKRGKANLKVPNPNKRRS